MQVPENYQQQLAALRQEYIRRLPVKLGEIESGWNSLWRLRWDAETLRTLHRRAHSLVGSGATFGFPALSETARALERIFKDLTGCSDKPDHSLAAEIEKLIMELRQSVVHASRELPSLSPEADTTPVEPEARQVGGKRVFLVEDDEISARDLALQLGHFGYEVRVFHTLAELRAAMQVPAPDTIIMDITMPDGDGTAALADLVRHITPRVPAIFVTCHADFESRLRAVRAGARAYMVKPVDIGELIDQLDRLAGTSPPDPYRILIIDDSPVLAEYYALILQHGGMLTRVSCDSMQAMAALEDFNADLILMDAYMPGCDGFELAAVLRQQETYMSIPIVFLSSETDLDKQLLALGSGADDFLTKPITPHHLVSVVTSRAQRARMLRELMLHDSLTGLLNHTTVKERLEKELAQATRHRVPVSLAMVDIDHFKSINDNHGHLAGDRVIKSLARLLQQRLRKSDVIGRYGGEEFLVMMNNTRGEDALALLEKLRHDFAELRHQSGAHGFIVTFSAGIASAPPGAHATTLTETADRALYQAKRQGRNRIVLVNT
jgi:diguanylate cyclase (GGDEF)-like protein